MKLITYLRVSTDEQSASGHGLDAQRDACQRHASRVDTPITGWFIDEGVSGTTPLEKRDGLMQALEQLERGDVLLVARRDRLARDAFVIATIEREVARKGARICSEQGEGTDRDDPGSIFMRRICDAAAEHERNLICARTKAALAAKKTRGERVGRIPFGMQLAADGVHLEPNQLEQEIIRLMMQLVQGGWSLRRIAKELNKLGHLKREGTPWNHVSVHRILKSAA